MKKTLAAAAALMILCTSGSVFAALPPGVFTSQRPPAHISSHRVHVNPSHRMHTPTGNRVRMTPTHGQTGPAGGRMSSMHHGYRHAGPPPGPHYSRVYVRPSLPPRWRHAGYYSGHYWRPYGGYIVAYPVGYYYGYPYYRGWGYYARPGVRISVRL